MEHISSPIRILAANTALSGESSAGVLVSMEELEKAQHRIFLPVDYFLRSCGAYRILYCSRPVHLILFSLDSLAVIPQIFINRYIGASGLFFFI
jgi:hypothetical protein